VSVDIVFVVLDLLKEESWSVLGRSFCLEPHVSLKLLSELESLAKVVFLLLEPPIVVNALLSFLFLHLLDEEWHAGRLDGVEEVKVVLAVNILCYLRVFLDRHLRVSSFASVEFFQLVLFEVPHYVCREVSELEHSYA
jgi:hypothetical protein